MTAAPIVAVLFARSDSIYYQIPGCDVYDIERDALTFAGGLPIIGHPPCRTWGALAHLATRARPGEKELAPWTIEVARREGGIVEHPNSSRLWKHCNCPPPDGKTRDFYGGICIRINQVEWGHKALKPTILYGVGVDFSRLVPVYPNAEPTHLLCRPSNPALRTKPSLTRGTGNKDTEGTPPALARQFVSLVTPPFPGREPTHCIAAGMRNDKWGMRGGGKPKPSKKDAEATPFLLAQAIVATAKKN